MSNKHKYCNTCGTVIKEKTGVSSPYLNKPPYVLDNCETCRKNRYSEELVVFSWDGYPEGSEGNVLEKILKYIVYRKYTEKDIKYVVIGSNSYKWDREAFNFPYFDDAGCHELCSFDRIVMVHFFNQYHRIMNIGHII